MMKKKGKIALIVTLSVLALVILTVVIYLLYVILSYKRIDDMLEEETLNNQEELFDTSKEYSILTYNIGFGAYSKEYSFFMDTGYMADGEKVTGKYAKGLNKEETEKNTNGVIEVIESIDPDFVFLQEVDEKANRSYFVNQREEIAESFPLYGSTYTVNFDTAYLLYPFNDPIGKTKAGLLNLSKVHVDSAIRRSYPVSNNLSKLFDLDRCFVLLRIKLNDDKELVLINSHMSAYDKGGVIRGQQLDLLFSVMKEEYEKGNYVIAGGDFNHILTEEADNIYPSEQLKPDWIQLIAKSDIPSHFSVVLPDNLSQVPSCRDAEIPYEKGVNYTSTIDGFIVSDNVKAKAMNIDTDFEYSDHNPVLLTFTLI